jgi:hypothetical protein
MVKFRSRIWQPDDSAVTGLENVRETAEQKVLVTISSSAVPVRAAVQLQRLEGSLEPGDDSILYPNR